MVREDVGAPRSGLVIMVGAGSDCRRGRSCRLSCSRIPSDSVDGDVYCEWAGSGRGTGSLVLPLRLDATPLESQGGVGNFVPALVDGEPVTAVGDLDELRDAGILELALVDGVVDGSWGGVVLLAETIERVRGRGCESPPLLRSRGSGWRSCLATATPAIVPMSPLLSRRGPGSTEPVTHFAGWSDEPDLAVVEALGVRLMGCQECGDDRAFHMFRRADCIERQ